jgi:hypothetical protein
MQTQNDFAPLFREGLREDFGDQFESWEKTYDQFLKVSSTDKAEQRAAIITGLSRLIEINDGEAVTLDKPRMSDVVQGIDREYGIGFAVTKRTVEDDQYGKANQAAKWLANAVNQTFEYRAASFLDDAFAGNIYKGIDNLPLMSTAHTLIGNAVTTVANRLTTAVGFSMSGITQLMQLCQNMKDENGDPIKMWPDKLILGNDAVNIHKALQIFNSEKEPYTSENQDNAIKKRLKIPAPIVNPYMTNTKWYFMIDDTYNDAHFVMRRKPTYEDHQDFSTGAMLNKVTCRFLIWFVLWRGWVGTNPSV